MDRIHAASTLAAPVRLDPAALDQVLRTVADHLTAMNPGTIMSAGALHTGVQVAVWDHHGTYDNVAVGPDINRVLGHVRDLPLTGTRCEYAMRLRLMLAGVTV